MSSYKEGTRRSHTKSRHGCKVCKRRHIRCDEAFPQCRNCTKHQVRCDYMDLQTSTSGSSPSDSPASVPSPDMYWSSEVEAVLDRWQKSGYCNVGDDIYHLSASGYVFSKTDLHLVYHALWSSGPNASMMSDYTIWTSKISKFLEAAGDAAYLIHAVLGFGSLSLAWDRGSQDAKSVGYQHGAVAMQGLQNAIKSFSQSNADAVLAVSVLLSWQANDFKAWQSLVAGIRSIVKQMSHWRSASSLQELLHQLQHEQPLSQPYEPYSSRPHDFQLNYQNTLQTVVVAMDQLQPYTTGRQEHGIIGQLRDYAQRLLAIKPATTPEDEFNHLYALRKWLFWVPTTILKALGQDYLTLVFLAHLYAMALAFEPLFPNVGRQLISAMSLAPLQNVLATFEDLRLDHSASSLSKKDMSELMQLLVWPRRVANSYELANPHHLVSPQVQSPGSFDFFSSGLNQATERFNLPAQSPGFAPQHSRSSTYSYSSQGSSGYLDLPMLSSNSPALSRSYPRSYASSNAPSSSGYDLDEPLYTESHYDYSTDPAQAKPGASESMSRSKGPAPRSRLQHQHHHQQQQQ